MRQLGMAFLQYMQDNDEIFPNGTQGNVFGLNETAGIGWAAQVYEYVKSPGVYACPDDSTSTGVNPAGFTTFPISYGYNENDIGKSQSKTENCSASVLLFEITGCQSDMTRFSYKNDPVQSGDYASFAADGNTRGWDGVGEYATGVMHGAQSSVGKGLGLFAALTGRHTDGSNFVFSDGHVKRLRAETVSTGSSDNSGPGTNCNEFTANPPVVNSVAAQTECGAQGFNATFGLK